MADKKKPKYVLAYHEELDEWLAELTPPEFKTWWALLEYTNGNGCAFPGFAALRKKSKLGKTAIHMAIKEFERRGMVIVTRAVKPNKSKEVNRYKVKRYKPPKDE